MSEQQFAVVQTSRTNPCSLSPEIRPLTENRGSKLEATISATSSVLILTQDKQSLVESLNKQEQLICHGTDHERNVGYLIYVQFSGIGDIGREDAILRASAK